MGRVTPVIDRLQAKVSLAGSCWEWTGALTRGGYGQIRVAGKLQYVHRVSYEHYVGEIPEGLCLDHLCRNRICVNPAHLEPVSGIENTRRGRSFQREKTHCPQGHEYTLENTYVSIGRDGGAHRSCRRCAANRAAARRVKGVAA